MTSRYVMLEANRLRSIDISQREENDIYKNKWTNLVSSSGIPINVGDTINIQQVIVNTKGASDEVIEFTGDENSLGFVDNKTDLKFSYYVNHTGRNTFALPSINHKTYIGNGPITDPVISDVTLQGGGVTTYATPNGAPNDSTIQVMLSRRSLGETLFAGTTDNGTKQAFFGDNLGVTGIMINSYFNGGYLLRLSTSQTGFKGTGAGSGGYNANQIYAAMIKIPTTTPTGTVAQSFVVELSDPVTANTQNFVIVEENAFNNAFPPITGYVLKKAGAVLGAIYKIERYKTAQLKLTLIPLNPTGGGTGFIPVSATNADQLDAVYESFVGPITVGPTYIGEPSGITIKVLTVTEANAPVANQVLTWEVCEADCFSPNLAVGSRTLTLSAINVNDGNGFPVLEVLTNTTFHELSINATINQDSFMSANDKKIDGSRYFLTNNGYTGLADKDETNINTNALDISTMVNNLDKRYNTTTLEIKPSFATPDNIGAILTDQLKEPTKLSLQNPLDNFINYGLTDYNYRSIQPLGRQVQYVTTEPPDRVGADDNSLIYRFQTGSNFTPNNKPVLVTTPTFKPMVCNMFGHGMPNILFNGEERNSNQPSLAGQRRIFYDSVAYKDMNRVMSLKNAFYNFNYPKPTHAIEYLRDIYLGTQLSDYINRNDKIYGDFGSVIQSELGMRVCCLNNFYVNGKIRAPKNSLIVTNMKYNESNLARLSTAFRKTEQYLGNLNNKVNTKSDDYKNHLAVNLDLGMYCDELSVNGHLQFAQIAENYKPLNDPPPTTPTKNQRTKFITLTEITPTQTETIYPVDHEEGYTCGGFKRDFLKNDGQELSSIWIKSRFQEGFTYENSKNPPANYTGDKIEGITQFLSQQETANYYASKYTEMNLNNDNQLGDYKYVSLTEADHTTIINFNADWFFVQPFRDGMTVVCTGGTINGVDVTGKISTISNVNLEAFVPPGPSFWLDQPFGTVAPGQEALNITIRILTPEEQRFFNGTWTDDGTTIRDMDYALSLAKKYDLAVVPMFQPVLEQARRCAGYHQTADYEYQDEVPLIAFISNYELDMMEESDFDTENLANPNNKWEIDSWNCNEGVQIGFDPSFTRNEAVAVCNVNIGNFSPNNKTSYENILMVGAVDPQINFNPSLSRFEFTGLNTPISLGNGLPSDLPENLIASESPEQQIFVVNQRGQIYPARPKLIGAGMTQPQPIGARLVSNFSPVYNQFTTNQKPGTIMDSQSGIGIESLILYDALGNKTEINEQDYDKYSQTLFSKIGFDLDQLLIPIGSEQSFFTNNFTFQNKYTYKQSYNNIIKPLTTGALISSSEIQSLSVNELNMPLFDLGIDQIIKQIQPDASQGSITAFGLPTKLDYPYLVVYSDIPGGASNTEFIGGDDSQSMIPAVGYLFRNEDNGDYFYGLESDITFTAVRDYVITEVDIDIRLPDGSRPRLSPHSAVIFKITKPLEIPYPQVILNQKSK